jgi:hypothetical protein
LAKRSLEVMFLALPPCQTRLVTQGFGGGTVDEPERSGLVGRLEEQCIRFVAWASARPTAVERHAASLTWATRGVIGGSGALLLAAVLVAGLALVAPHTKPAAPSAAPVTAATTSPLATSSPTLLPTSDDSMQATLDPSGATFPPFPSETPTESPSPMPSEWPTPVPTPTPAPPPGTTVAKVTITTSCQAAGDDYETRAASGTTFYAQCVDDPDGSAGTLYAIDTRTGNVAARYQSVWGAFAVDHGVWVTTPRNEYDIASIYEISRIDISTGRQTFHLAGWRGVADGLGYIWAVPSEADKKAMRIDPVTAARTVIAWPYRNLNIACGSLWGFDSAGLHRVDPMTGALLSTIPDSSGIDELVEVDGRCWGMSNSRIVRIGTSAVEFRGPVVAADRIEGFGGTLWGVKGSGYWTKLQRIDPATGQLVGQTWAIPSAMSIWEAGGYVWFDRVDNLMVCRLDVPLEPLPSAPPSAPSPSPAPAA